MKKLTKDQEMEEVRVRCEQEIRKLIGSSEEITSQRDFCRETDINFNRISLIMTGQAVPLLWEIIQISRTCNVSADYLLFGKRSARESATEAKQALQEQIRILQETVKKL